MKKEIYKKIDIEGYENYSISNFGNIMNNRTNIILKPDISNMGYERVNLYNTLTKKQKKFAIHRLVAKYFVEGFKEELVVNHKDGDKRNNHYLNLEWVTSSENNKHAYETHLKNEDGVNNPANVYDEETIHSICKLIESGKFSTKEISHLVFNDYSNIYKNLINHIKAHRRWTCISQFYNF